MRELFRKPVVIFGHPFLNPVLNKLNFSSYLLKIYLFECFIVRALFNDFVQI